MSEQDNARAVRGRAGGGTGALRAAVALAAIIGSMAVILTGAESVSRFFREGLELAATRVLPTAFPFMVMSSLVSALFDPGLMPHLSRAVSSLFSLGGGAAAPIIVGSLAGFPVGARMAAEGYMRGELTRSEAERLLAYADNPSPPFVVAVVGGGILGDVRLGVILLISVWSGTLLSAQLMREKTRKMQIRSEIRRQKYDFVASVKSAAISSVYMMAFVTLFYIIICAVRESRLFEPLRTLLILTLEVTGAVAHLGGMTSLSPTARLGLVGFALGFGGISVMAQVSAVTGDSGLSMRKYVILKIAEGLFTALISMALSALLVAV